MSFARQRNASFTPAPLFALVVQFYLQGAAVVEVHTYGELVLHPKLVQVP